MRRRLALIALLTVASLAVLPQAAGANVFDIPSLVPQRFRAAVRERVHVAHPHRGFEASLRLQARDGFEIGVFGIGNAVAIEVTRPNPHPSLFERLFHIQRAATAYVTRGTVTRHRIAASFGHYGRVDVRFHPSGRVTTSDPQRHCTGPDHYTRRLGVFAGTVRFRGEKHYVSTEAHRARGRIRTPLQLACRHFFFALDNPAALARPVPQHPSFEATALNVGHREATAGTEFFAYRFGRATLFLAMSDENTGRMAKIRYGFATSHSKRFSTNDSLTTATVRPPAPFHGTGSYAAAADGTTTWKGGLSISLPGAPHLSLAGPQFVTTLESGF